MSRSQGLRDSKWGRSALAACLLAIGPSARPSTSPGDTLRSNEAEAISTLRAIAAAQASFKALAAVDTNCDGVGEYGYFAELAATRPLRVGCGCTPCAGGRADVLGTPLLQSDFGIVKRFVVQHRGYLFQMWLPALPAAKTVHGLAEDLTGGKTDPPFPGSEVCEQFWCCYAWPIRYGSTGREAYFINERGTVLHYSNVSAVPYNGSWVTPYFDDAYTIPSMSSPLRIGVANGWGRIWRPLP